jgi:hypothetical protein
MIDPVIRMEDGTYAVLNIEGDIIQRNFVTEEAAWKWLDSLPDEDQNTHDIFPPHYP